MHQTWDIERHPERGVRAVVKLYPSRRGALPRYRRMCGTWQATGVEQRDYYVSKLGLMQRVAEVERSGGRR